MPSVRAEAHIARPEMRKHTDRHRLLSYVGVAGAMNHALLMGLRQLQLSLANDKHPSIELEPCCLIDARNRCSRHAAFSLHWSACVRPGLGSEHPAEAYTLLTAFHRASGIERLVLGVAVAIEDKAELPILIKPCNCAFYNPLQRVSPATGHGQLMHRLSLFVALSPSLH
ncbi:MAG TPA: hypothetical protein PKC18_00515 [Lacipirellulaceae bacterium]|nr:hypothetical protein [Lacipirellulaceae bacterium]